MAYPTGELSIDLRAIADNWRLVHNRLKGKAECGAVVKANAYGLGVDRIAPKLYQAGCRNFFVANFKEALQLSSLVGRDVRIFVLSGCIAGAEREFILRNIVPVIVSMPMMLRWSRVAREYPDAQAALKINTGMGRLGLEQDEFASVLQDVTLLENSRIRFLMSHFACADTPEDKLNSTQQARFEQARRGLERVGVHVKTTLANSAGVFLGEQAHCDIVRPGIALYGGNPAGLEPNPMHPVVSLSLPIIQIRRLPAGEYIGYGATRSFPDERLIAVASGGYADGMMRCLSNKGWGYLRNVKVPIVGRISMDSTMFDVSGVPGADALQEGDPIEVLGEHVSIDDMASAANTISYEILTSIGSRYQRSYIE